MKNTSSLENAAGDLQYRLTNDVLFHIVMERSEPALRGLLAALLGIQKNEILTLHVQNPIHFGEHVDSKEIVLDVEVLLNHNVIINIEMQVRPQAHWTNRVLFYVMKIVGKYNPGSEYENLQGVIHIGILDHHLFKDSEGFYSRYQLMNAGTGKVFSDKLQINVLDLGRINQATEEDKTSGLVYWARLFKATTWEQIKEIAKMDDALKDAAETMYSAQSDEELKWYLLRREMFLRDREAEREYARREARKEGLAEGRAEGRAEGELRKLVVQICRKLRKKLEVNEIAEALEEDPADVKRIVSAAAPFAPDYDEERVYKALVVEND